VKLVIGEEKTQPAGVGQVFEKRVRACWEGKEGSEVSFKGKSNNNNEKLLKGKARDHPFAKTGGKRGGGLNLFPQGGHI